MAGPPERMQDDEAIGILEKMARDPDLKATQRLRALEQLGQWRRAAAGGVAPTAAEAEQQAPDPFADLDEVEKQRRKRAGRRAS